ncbi:MAG: hypothetical protein CL868_03365 [Cytophagaceae bacterium]|nr:hypothetical protein [Cytophagaceae bacterium]|tara:strand:- start:1662 stop:1919 length:258 start_codon:yes stop_codon:yes gene_type:complete
MGFGGAVSAMITSLKNNKRERKSRFDTPMLGYRPKKFVDHKKCSPEHLEAIRKRIKAEQSLIRLRANVLTSISLILIIALLYWLL